MNIRTATLQKIDALLRVVEPLKTRDYPQYDVTPVALQIAQLLANLRSSVSALPPDATAGGGAV